MLRQISTILGVITCLIIAYLAANMSDIAKLNSVLFNKLAPEYDERYGSANGFITEQIKRDSSGFIGVKQGGRLLDYACGTGLITEALADELSQSIGMDVSATMVEAYNAKAASQGILPEKRKAYLGDLLTPGAARPGAFSSPEFFNFDMVGVGLGFHHFADPKLAARRLVERLSVGGVLFIVDLLPHAPDRSARGVVTSGFSQEEMRKLFEDAGAGSEFRFKILDQELVLQHGNGHGHSHRHGHGGHGHDHGHAQHGHGHEPHSNGRRYQVFFARGVKV